MPRPPTLKIIEIFASLQGEGLRQGQPTVFIRFSGCNLKCSFCDTRYAWNGGRELTPSQALQEIQKIRSRYPADWACLTGGEPLLQDVSGIVEDLRKEGFKIQVETNATLYRPLTVDWYTVSPKPPRYSYRPEYRKRAKEVKLVVTRSLSFGTVERLRKEFPARIPLLLQPESNAPWSVEKGLRYLNRAMKAGLENIRLSVQLHKLLHLR
jgi:organic radical activating enzyme